MLRVLTRIPKGKCIRPAHCRGIVKTSVYRPTVTCVRHFSLPRQPTPPKSSPKPSPKPYPEPSTSKYDFETFGERYAFGRNLQESDTPRIGKDSTTSVDPKTLEGQVLRDWGLSRYVRKVYTKVGLGSAATVGALMAAPHFEVFANHPLEFGLGGLVTGLVSIGVMASKTPKIVQRNNHPDDETDFTVEAGFWGLVGSMSLSTAPFATMVYEISPMILPSAAIITTSVMAGASLYAYRTDPTKFVSWKGPLFGGLLGLVGINVIGIINVLFFGSNAAIFHLMHDVNVYAGLGIFTLYTSYDTYEMVTDYKNNKVNHINHATNFYLNFVNLLVRIMEIMAKAKKN